MDSFEKLNICIVSPLGYTGLAYYDHGLCESLSEIGVQVTLVTSEKTATLPKKISYKVIKLFKNTYGDISRAKKSAAYALCMFKLCRFILKNDFKVVHFQYLELPPLDYIIFLILKAWKIKIVFTPHDIYSFKPKETAKVRNLLYKTSDIIIVHNQSNRDQLVNEFAFPEEKVRIVEHGNYNYFIDPNISQREAKERLGLPQDKKIVLLFGSIRPGKGTEIALHSLKFLPRGIKDVLLLIAGKPARGFDMERLKKEIKDEHLENSVILTDSFIEDELIQYYYRAADAVLVPYERAYESGVLKFAFSCGKPVVLSSLPIFSEFARDNENCLLFKTGDPQDLAKKTGIVLEDAETAGRISRKAKELSDKEWDWRKIAVKTRSIYEKLL